MEEIHINSIFEQGFEQFPLTRVVFTNILMVFWIGLGTLACGFFNNLLSWIYLASAFLMVFVVLRKAVCTHCYYYDKWCPAGWGKLSALLFSQGNVQKFTACLGVKSAPVTYGLLLLIPLVFGTIGLIRQFTLTKIIILILLVLTAAFSGTVNRKKACVNCKMNLICPGGKA
jgi:hypothetical protein